MFHGIRSILPDVPIRKTFLRCFLPKVHDSDPHNKFVMGAIILPQWSYALQWCQCNSLRTPRQSTYMWPVTDVRIKNVMQCSTGINIGLWGWMNMQKKVGRIPTLQRSQRYSRQSKQQQRRWSYLSSIHHGKKDRSDGRPFGNADYGIFDITQDRETPRGCYFLIPSSGVDPIHPASLGTT